MLLPFRKRVLVSFLVAVISASCASVNPVGLMKLASLDPLSTDPAYIAVAARLPQSLKLRTGDLVLTIETDKQTGPDAFRERFFLEINENSPSDAGTISVEPNERLQTARIAQKDIERLRNTQTKARELSEKANGAKTGSFQIRLVGGCKTQELGDGALITNIYMKTEGHSTWFAVLNNADLRNDMKSEELAKLPTC